MKTRRTEKQRSRLRLETLEPRLALATYTWDDAANTLSVSLATNQSLTVTQTGANAYLSIDSGLFTQVGGTAATLDFGRFVFPLADVASSISIDNALATTSGFVNNVTFSGSGLLTTGTLNVSLTDPDASGTIAFNGGFDVTVSAALNLTSVNTVRIPAGTELTAVGGGTLTLSANQQTTPRFGFFPGVEISGGVLSADTGAITVLGRSGNGNYAGVGLSGTTSRIATGGTARVEGNSPAGSPGVAMGTAVLDAAGDVLVKGGSVDYRGVELSGSTITSQAGSVTVEGTGKTEGIYANAGAIEALGATTSAGAIVRGSAVGTFAIGVSIGGAGSRVRTNAGPLLVEGTGGVGIGAGAVISTTADNPSATLAVTSLTTGGVGVGGTDAQITTTRGAINVNGVGGVRVVGGGKIVGQGAGADSTVTVIGTNTNTADGVTVTGANSAIAANGGELKVDGTGRRGLYLFDNAAITTTAAPLSVKGTATGTADGLSGAYLSNSSKIQSGAALTVEGTGIGGVYLSSSQLAGGGTAPVVVRGTATTTGRGIEGLTAQVTSGGTLLVEGTGGNGASTSLNQGIYWYSSSSLVGEGDVTVNGTGGNRTAGTGSSNIGVFLDLQSQMISNNGSMAATGNGGGVGSSFGNTGVYNGGRISALGAAGTVTVTGQGGNLTGTGGGNLGIYVSSGFNRITSAGGALSVTGTGGGGGSGTNLGIDSEGEIKNLGTNAEASVTVRGTGGSPSSTQSDNIGVRLTNTLGPISSAGGAVTVIGTGANPSTNYAGGVSLYNAKVTGPRDVTVTAAAKGPALVLDGPGAQITSTGGAVFVEGRALSGTNGGGIVLKSARIGTDGGTGAVTVRGTAESANTFDTYAGVNNNGGTIVSAGGPLLLEGTVAGNAKGHGIVVSSFSRIENAGLGGSLTIRGVAGGNNLSSGNSDGINLASYVLANGGPILLEGTGGPGSTAFNNSGLNLAGALIMTSGPIESATITMTGTAGGAANGIGNYGIQSLSTISASGAITLTGTGNGMNSAEGLRLGSSISGSAITLVADTMNLASGLNANGGTISVRPKTAGTPLNLGGFDVLTGSPKTLGLTDQELDGMSAGQILLGDNTTGPVTVSAATSRSSSTNVSLTSAGAIQFTTGSISTTGGNLTLDAGTFVSPAASGVDATVGTLAFSPGDQLALALNGTTVDSQYRRLNVAGGVNLTGVTLALSGTYMPVFNDRFTLVENDGTDAIVGTFTGLPEGAVIENFLGGGLPAQLSYVGGSGNDVVLTIQSPAQRVTSVTPLANGVKFSLNKPAVVGDLNLYDYRDPSGQWVLGDADVRLVDGAGKAIAGSLLVAANNQDFTFLATAGALPAGTYTLSLRSGANGFHTATGEAFDGDGDNLPGGAYATTFTVAAAPAVVVSLPHFSRGPEQTVNLPPEESLGIPVRISDGAGVSSLTFELQFDPELLNVTGATSPGGTVVFTSLAAGRVRVAVTLAIPMSAGPQLFAYVQANVPSTAAARYGERNLLDLSALDVRGASNQVIAASDQDAVQTNAYHGDLGRNGRYDSYDVQQASRLALDLDTGLRSYPLLDAVLMTDFNANQRPDSFDVQRVSRLALNLPVTEVAALPASPPPTTDTGRFASRESAKQLRSDVDGNGVVDAQDILWAVYALEQTGRDPSLPKTSPLKLDVNEDNSFDAADILTTLFDFDPPAADSAVAAGESGPADEALNALATMLAHDAAMTRKKR